MATSDETIVDEDYPEPECKPTRNWYHRYSYDVRQTFRRLFISVTVPFICVFSGGCAFELLDHLFNWKV